MKRLTILIYLVFLTSGCSVEIPESTVGPKTSTETATSTATGTSTAVTPPTEGERDDSETATPAARASSKTKVTVVVETEAEAEVDADGEADGEKDQPTDAGGEHALYRPGAIDFDDAKASAPAGYRLATHEEVLAVREAGKFDAVQAAVGNLWTATEVDAENALVVYLGSAAVRTENKRELHGALYVKGDAQ